MPNDNRVTRAIDPRFLPALRVLVQQGAATPTRLDLSDVVLCGEPRPDLSHLEILDDGSLSLKTIPSPIKVREVDPEHWDPSFLRARVAVGGMLVIDQGAISIVQTLISPDGSSPRQTGVRIYGWSWHVDDDPSVTVLWAARLRFSSSRMPIFLWWPNGNMFFRAGDEAVRGWQFETPYGPVFLVRRDDEWFIAFGSSQPPLPNVVLTVLSAIGFAFGEDIGVDIFRSISSSSVGTEMRVLSLRPIGRRVGQEAPALPLDIARASFVAFVEGILRFDAAEPEASIDVAIHQYFQSLDGIIESQLLHSWIAAEALAKWSIRERRLKFITQQRIADHSRWLEWCNVNRVAIEGFANTGQQQSLFDRVRDADSGRQNAVQLVFKGEALEWTPQMDDAEKARNSTAHEGVMPDDNRNWPLDWSRVGLVRTMLTALIAKLIGYTGRIADRARTYNDIAESHEPTWWKAVVPPEDVVYVEDPAGDA